MEYRRIKLIGGLLMGIPLALHESSRLDRFVVHAFEPSSLAAPRGDRLTPASRFYDELFEKTPISRELWNALQFRVVEYLRGE